MDRKEPILVLHDYDRIGRSVVRRIRLPGAHAVGERLAADPAVLAAANMSGIGALVVVVRDAVDFSALRKRGVPYTVLRAAPLPQELVTTLEPVLASGRLILEANDDVSRSRSLQPTIRRRAPSPQSMPTTITAASSISPRRRRCS